MLFGIEGFLLLGTVCLYLFIRTMDKRQKKIDQAKVEAVMKKGA